MTMVTKNKIQSDSRKCFGGTVVNTFKKKKNFQIYFMLIIIISENNEKFRVEANQIYFGVVRDNKIIYRYQTWLRHYTIGSFYLRMKSTLFA